MSSNLSLRERDARSIAEIGRLRFSPLREKSLLLPEPRAHWGAKLRRPLPRADIPWSCWVTIRRSWMN